MDIGGILYFLSMLSFVIQQKNRELSDNTEISDHLYKMVFTEAARLWLRLALVKWIELEDGGREIKKNLPQSFVGIILVSVPVAVIKYPHNLREKGFIELRIPIKILHCKEFNEQELETASHIHTWKYRAMNGYVHVPSMLSCLLSPSLSFCVSIAIIVGSSRWSIAIIRVGPPTSI